MSCYFGLLGAPGLSALLRARRRRPGEKGGGDFGVLFLLGLGTIASIIYIRYMDTVKSDRDLGRKLNEKAHAEAVAREREYLRRLKAGPRDYDGPTTEQRYR